jgi:hypothetical protein
LIDDEPVAPNRNPPPVEEPTVEPSTEPPPESPVVRVDAAE